MEELRIVPVGSKEKTEKKLAAGFGCLRKQQNKTLCGPSMLAATGLKQETVMVWGSWLQRMLYSGSIHNPQSARAC